MLIFLLWAFFAAILFGVARGVTQADASPRQTVITWGLAAVIFVGALAYFQPWDRPVVACLDALESRYSHLTFSRPSLGDRVDGQLEGQAVIRTKGTRQRQSKNVSCSFDGYRVVAAECPGCP